MSKKRGPFRTLLGAAIGRMKREISQTHGICKEIWQLASEAADLEAKVGRLDVPMEDILDDPLLDEGTRPATAGEMDAAGLFDEKGPEEQIDF